TVAGVPVLAASLGNQVQREIPIIGAVAVTAVGACFLFIPWTRRSRRLLPVGSTVIAVGLTVAVFGWLDRPLSLGVMAFLSVLLGIGSYYPTYFAQRARRRTVLVVATATAASFATLSVSPLPFVRDLGLAMALGVLLSALLGMLLTWGRPSSPAEAATGTTGPTTRNASRAKRLAMGAGAVAIAAAGWVALPGIPMESSPQSFAAGLSDVDDARHVEEVLGSSGEFDVVLRGKNVTSTEALAWMRRAQQAIIAAHGDQLRPIISPPTLLSFLGSQPSTEQVDAGLRFLPRYLTSAAIRGDNEVALLSFGVRMNDLDALRELRDQVSAELPPPPPGYRAELAGLPMVAVRGHELLSQDRVASNVLGIVAAGAVLAMGLRRRIDAVRAIAAAIIATGAALAGLAALGIPLSPVTVALGSLTAAVACEFTVLLSAATGKNNLALRRSVVLATAASMAGYAVLAVSQLAVIREFGLLLAGSVLLSYLAARLVTWLTVRPDLAGPDVGSVEDSAPKASVEMNEKYVVGVR
ncbi:MAG: RND transporter, partial [Thermocrispum sp.]